MPANHYFSETPEGELVPREISVTLGGVKTTVVTAGGVFSPEHIDQGTQVLLAHIASAKPTGIFLDIGCGWGPIALALAIQSPKATIYAVDVNERCLELTKINAQKLGLNNIIACKPEDVPVDVLFDEVWSNPPIRVGKEMLHEILTYWLQRLNKASVARLVVQKNLGSDSLQKWLSKELPQDFETSRMDSAKSFRVLKVTRN